MITVKYQLQLLKIKSERANQNLFSTYSPKIALIQHARQPDLTQIRKSEHSKGDQFMLFVAYCSLYARACDNWPETRAFKLAKSFGWTRNTRQPYLENGSIKDV